jgi:hypothetical protein
VEGDSAGELVPPFTGGWTDYTDSARFEVSPGEGDRLLDFIRRHGNAAADRGDAARKILVLLGRWAFMILDATIRNDSCYG